MNSIIAGLLGALVTTLGLLSGHVLDWNYALNPDDGPTFGAPAQSFLRSLIPIDATENIGTSTAPWDEGHFNQLCLSADCRTAWPSPGGGGGGGSGTISTSTTPSIGNLAYWTGLSTLGTVATGTLSCSSPLSCTARAVIGGSSTLSLDTTGLANFGKAWEINGSGYLAPTTTIDVEIPQNIGVSNGGIYLNGLGDSNWRIFRNGTDINFFMSGSPGGRYFNFGNNDGINDVVKIEALTGSTTFAGRIDFPAATTSILTAGTLCLSSDCRTTWPSGGSGLATSTAIADTQIIYGTSASTVGSEAAFAYNSSTNLLSVDSVALPTNGRFLPGGDSASQLYWDGSRAILSTVSLAAPVRIEGNALEFRSGGASNYAQLVTTGLSASRNFTFPDLAGTFALTGAGQTVTFGNASSTLLSSAYASSTVWRGGGLDTDCDADNQALGWDITTGQFVCGDDDTGEAGGLSAYDAWTHPSAGYSATTSILQFPAASTTRLSTYGPAYFGATATSTFGTDGSLSFGGAAGVKASAASGILTLLGLSGSGEDLSFDFSQSDTVELTTTSGVSAITVPNSLRFQNSGAHNSYIDLDSTQTEVGFSTDRFIADGTTLSLNLDSGTNILRWTNTGLGLDATPTYKLDVNGAGRFTSYVDAANFIATSTTLNLFPFASSTAFSTIYASTTSLFGAGLTDCDTGASSKLLWDTTTGQFSCGTDQTAAGGLSSYDAWTHPGAGISATTSEIRITGGFLSTASSTFSGNATTTGNHAFGTVRVPLLTSALLQTDANGLFAEYAGTNCTNQVITAFSALGAATCTTINGNYLDLAANYAWTGEHDFGGATSLEIPNGTGNTTDAIGEMAFDTSDFQLLIATTTANTPRAIPTMQRIWAATIASTSPDLISGGRIWLPIQRDGYDMVEIHCAVDGGTSIVINISNSAGSADTETVTCDADGQSDTSIDTNSVFSAGALMSLEIGTKTGSVDYLTFSVYGLLTRE